MIPIVAMLLEQGLSLLGNAVIAKGKDVVESQLGIKLPDPATPLSAQDVNALRAVEMEHEKWLIDSAIRKEELSMQADAADSKNVTDRWTADMASDTPLARNIRPAVLAYLTVALTLMAVVPINIDSAWIDLLKASYITVLAAYFGGRTVEKYTKIKGDSK